jgi:very-short-patch-repair endonuclease
MNKPFIPYNKKLKHLSRSLRNNSTLAEVLLWNELKAGKIRGYKFNRQKPIGNYIADFYCKKLNLVIEIDGSSHINKELKDIYRQIKLEKFKLYFLRFEDIEVKQSLHNVLHKMKSILINLRKLKTVLLIEKVPFIKGE